MTKAKKDPVEPHPAWYQRSTSDILLIITALGGIVISIVSLYTQQKVDAVQEKVAVSSEKAAEKLEVIHLQGNSTAKRMEERLDAAYEKINNLEKLLLKAEEKSPDEETDP